MFISWCFHKIFWDHSFTQCSTKFDLHNSHCTASHIYSHESLWHCCACLYTHTHTHTHTHAHTYTSHTHVHITHTRTHHTHTCTHTHTHMHTGSSSAKQYEHFMAQQAQQVQRVQQQAAAGKHPQPTPGTPPTQANYHYSQVLLCRVGVEMCMCV